MTAYLAAAGTRDSREDAEATLNPPKTTTLSRRSLAQQVADALVEHIISEGLSEGQPLPSTAELSERFGVSRTVVREALAALAGRGVLTQSQGRESAVSIPNASDLGQLLRFRVHGDDVSQHNILDTRLGLEVISAKLAAENASDEDVVEMYTQLKLLNGAKNDTGYHQADIRLHRAIAVASRNPLILMILDALEELLLDIRVKATRHRRGRGESLAPVIAQHRKIVEAIEAHDAAAAGDTMREHLENLRRELD
jgi:GntR family transcriptional repressor for pyruvate dehydrogenase complex